MVTEWPRSFLHMYVPELPDDDELEPGDRVELTESGRMHLPTVKPGTSGNVNSKFTIDKQGTVTGWSKDGFVNVLVDGYAKYRSFHPRYWKRIGVLRVVPPLATEDTVTPQRRASK